MPLIFPVLIFSYSLTSMEKKCRKIKDVFLHVFLYRNNLYKQILESSIKMSYDKLAWRNISSILSRPRVIDASDFVT